jgi:hypothetical protein
MTRTVTMATVTMATAAMTTVTMTLTVPGGPGGPFAAGRRGESAVIGMEVLA